MWERLWEAISDYFCMSRLSPDNVATPSKSTMRRPPGTKRLQYLGDRFVPVFYRIQCGNSRFPGTFAFLFDFLSLLQYGLWKTDFDRFSGVHGSILPSFSERASNSTRILLFSWIVNKIWENDVRYQFGRGKGPLPPDNPVCVLVL